MRLALRPGFFLAPCAPPHGFPADPAEDFRGEQPEVVFDGLQFVAARVRPVAMPEHLPEGGVLVGQLMDAVVVGVQPQPQHPEHKTPHPPPSPGRSKPFWNCSTGSWRQPASAFAGKHINDDPDLRRRGDLLDSIPGIGEAIRAHLLVALSDHYGFDNAKQAVAHAGLDPKIKESGKWTGKTCLSKSGDPMLRKALYMPALSAWRHNPAIRAFCERSKPTARTARLSFAPPCAN